MIFSKIHFVCREEITMNYCPPKPYSIISHHFWPASPWPTWQLTRNIWDILARIICASPRWAQLPNPTKTGDLQNPVLNKCWDTMFCDSLLYSKLTKRLCTKYHCIKQMVKHVKQNECQQLLTTPLYLEMMVESWDAPEIRRMVPPALKGLHLSWLNNIAAKVQYIVKDKHCAVTKINNCKLWKKFT